MSNIKELIFAEIKRLIRDPNLCSTTERRVGGHTALLKLLAFLDTLPDEPVSDDLEEHTKEWVELMVGASFPEQDGDFISEEDYRSVIKKTAIHFAEWMKRKMMDGAEDCELYWDGDFLAIDLNMRELGYSERDKVSIIILPKED